MSEFEKHMVPMTLDQALKVFDKKPTEVQPEHVKPLTPEEAIEIIKNG